VASSKLAFFLHLLFPYALKRGGTVEARKQHVSGIELRDTGKVLEFYALISRIPCSCGGRVTIGYDGVGRISQVYPVCTLCGEEIEVSDINRSRLEELLG
jgi:hypothetical protein